MSAIWGVISLSGKRINSDLTEVFENEYRRKTKLDSYDSKITEHAIIGRGLQQITVEDEYDNGIICEDGTIFAADCILDNRKELLKSIFEDSDMSKLGTQDGFEQKKYQNISDSQLLYLAYKKYGMDFVSHCIGSFALAIWNENDRKLTLISDHVASRSLYYTKKEDRVYFSTILSPIVKCIENPAINEQYIKDFLLCDGAKIYTVPGQSHVQDVYLMNPAHVKQFIEKEETDNNYWDLSQTKPDEALSVEEVIDNFMHIYEKCVNDAKRTKGKIAITLSGGLDSSSIAALAAKDNKEQFLYSYTSIPDIKVDKDTQNSIHDESVLVEDIVKMYPNIKPQYLSNAQKSDFTDIEVIQDIFEMPYKTAPFSSHLEICQKASEDGCKVILVGEYGNTSVSFGELDNILYDFYSKKDSSSMIKYAGNYCAHEGINAQEYLMNKLSVFRAYDKFLSQGHSVYDNFVPDNVFLSPEILVDYNLPERMKLDTRATLSKGFITAKQYRQFVTGESLQIYLGVLKTKFGLATGTILRDPTMDKRMIEFCYNLKFNYFAYNGKNRFLIREGFAKLLPETIIDRWRLKGVQSADWSERIERDWHILKPVLLDIVSKAPGEWILVDAAVQFIEEINFESKEDKIKLQSLFNIINVTMLLESFT